MRNHSWIYIHEMTSLLTRSPSTQRLYLDLRELALARTVGECLGSEKELLVACVASRPTFRHAIALLECERLVEVRRGNGGGYFVCRPTAVDAAVSAATYCHAIGITRDEVHSAWLPLKLEAVRLAASKRGGKASGELEQFIAELAKRSDRRFAVLVRRFNTLLTRMTENRLLTLFLEILYESGNPIDQLDFYRRDPGRIATYRAQMLRMAQAIAAGEANEAVDAARACFALNGSWLVADSTRSNNKLL